jgi:hypothetical protein
MNKRLEKRLQKEQYEKELIRLQLKQNELYKKLRDLPWIDLETPIQRGYMRTFELREDIGRSSDAEFYTNLLEKINTKMYSNDIKFLKRGRKKNRKKMFNEREQNLRRITQLEWEGKKLILSEKERQCFESKLVFNQWRRVYEKEFIFRESWRYVLKIAPNIITKTRLHDPQLSSELGQLERHIETNNLLGKICKARGKSYHKYSDYDKKPHKFENIDWVKEIYFTNTSELE